MLSEIERRTGRPIAELFDLIAGTSTGGIIALGLTKPGDAGKPQYAAADLVRLYQEKGSTIFKSSAWHRVESLWGIAEERYPSDGIEEVLKTYFGAAHLKDALTDVLITSYEIEQRFPFFFKSSKAKQPDKPDYDFPMWEVARATSAAPTYFEPFKLTTNNLVDYYVLIDGGVFANNPSRCAYVEVTGRAIKSNGILRVRVKG